ncbi:PEP-CTERM sorting domain-containing protein [Ideonella sp.]|uniref:PEP-CTERM sorting domain-containing protein n=1 Tax=Ideonella sp. TaxID=1929293 RepID=UPI003BB59431
MNINSVFSASAMRSAICAALAVAGVVMAPAAHADSYTTSTGNTISWVLTDLNTSDGVTSAITFNSGATAANFAAFWFTDTTNDSGTGGTSWYESLTIPSETFLLTANTAVTFSVNYSLSAYATEAGEYSSTTMSFTTSGNGAPQTAYATASASFVDGVTSNTESGSLSVTYRNRTGSETTGRLSGAVDSSGYGAVAAIPEPGTYAMFLAGLAAMGAVARRRRVK